MPKGTKELKDNNLINNKENSIVFKKTTKKDATLSKGASGKSSATSKKSTKKSSLSSVKSSKKSTKVSAKKEPKSSTKKVKSSNTKKSVSKTNNSISVLEYYDLPYRYNETIVRVLFQTPKTLFVYWDISDNDRKNYIKLYGNNFFDETVPYLLIHNKTKNYYFELEINDFANSWYFNVSDENCEYSVELFRRSKQISNNTISNLFIASSNKITTPNNHILFDTKNKSVYFRNVKNNNIIEKSISNFEFLTYIGKIYNVYDLYKKIYKNEEILNLDNPSSGNPTSTFN